MDAIPHTRLRSNLAREMDRVCEDHAPVIVTRKASSSVVMISLDDYEALEETSYLLRSPKSVRRDCSSRSPSWKRAAGRRGSLPSEGRLLRARLGRLSLLAEVGPKFDSRRVSRVRPLRGTIISQSRKTPWPARPRSTEKVIDLEGGG